MAGGVWPVPLCANWLGILVSRRWMPSTAPCLADYKDLPPWCEAQRLAHAFRIDEATPSNNTLKAMHFHAYRQARNRLESKVLASLGGKRPAAPLVVSGVFIARHCTGSLDWDNAYGGLKPLLDCLVAPSKRNPSGLGLVLDDNPRAMPEPPYVRQLKAKRGQSFCDVFVFDCSSLQPSDGCRAAEQCR